MVKFKVIKNIPTKYAWEVGADVGDILHVSTWESAPTLMKEDKAVCDLGSQTEKEFCERIS